MSYRLRQASDFEIYIAIKGPNDCWPWLGLSKHKYGYGLFSLFNLKTGKFNGVCSHRVAWMLYRGDIPDGLEVRHKCDNPECCNPNHLELGTHQVDRNGTHKRPPLERTKHLQQNGNKRCRACRRISMGYES